jgi:LPXTG-site transpeptidase (sortase) family protein
MTLAETAVRPVGAPVEVSPSATAPRSRARAAATRVLSPAKELATSAIIVLSITLLAFAVDIAFVSRLQHDRAQHLAYADFRRQLAQATAPIGQTEPTNAAKLLPLGTSVAVLAIPEIGLRQVVFEGTTGGVMEKGPGHLRSTPLPGQIGYSQILGRAAAFGGPFAKISELNVGDSFTVTTGQGVADYRVIDVRRSGDPQPPALDADHGRLILTTADGSPFLPAGVLRVDADLISTPQAADPRVLTSADISPAEQPMATDPSAWYPLVIWGQALLLAVCLLSWARWRWGRGPTWIVAVPVIGYLGLSVANQAARLLPNLM